MNRRKFLKASLFSSLAAFLPIKLFGDKQNNEKIEKYEFFIQKVYKEGIRIVPLGNHGLEINKEISLIRMESDSSYFLGKCFFHKDKRIITQSYFGFGQFQSRVNDIPYPYYVNKVEDFKFDLSDGQFFKFTLFI